MSMAIQVWDWLRSGWLEMWLLRVEIESPLLGNGYPKPLPNSVFSGI
jgi:hypothetical protein